MQTRILNDCNRSTHTVNKRVCQRLDQKFLSQCFAPTNTGAVELSKPDLKCFHSTELLVQAELPSEGSEQDEKK